MQDVFAPQPRLQREQGKHSNRYGPNSFIFDGYPRQNCQRDVRNQRNH
jgi:hypothetical protein